MAFARTAKMLQTALEAGAGCRRGKHLLILSLIWGGMSPHCTLKAPLLYSELTDQVKNLELVCWLHWFLSKTKEQFSFIQLLPLHFFFTLSSTVTRTDGNDKLFCFFIYLFRFFLMPRLCYLTFIEQFSQLAYDTIDDLLFREHSPSTWQNTLI